MMSHCILSKKESCPKLILFPASHQVLLGLAGIHHRILCFEMESFCSKLFLSKWKKTTGPAAAL